MIAFCIHGQYDRDGTGVREWCYDPEHHAFVMRWRRWASDEWITEKRLELPDFHTGASLLNALAHAHPRDALRVAEHLRAYGPAEAAAFEDCQRHEEAS